ncbi:MAG: HK97 gp10 family phage protein [Candidatus Riesia sp.]|nr:HK97 gp10 family phage protein [Candidatus Riesia sp.]
MKAEIVINSDTLTPMLRGTVSRLKGAVHDNALYWGQILEESIQETISGTGKGRIYFDTPVGIHQASAPGDPPAYMTGNLFRSFQTKILSISNYITYVAVGSPLSYAAWLEFGTSRIEERPYMQASVERARVDIEKNIRGFWRQVFVL